jgi:hypothetical protein
MDLRAAVLAGLIAGAIFLLALMVGYWLVTGSSPWAINHFIAAVVLGRSALESVDSFSLPVLLVSVIVHMVYSLLLTLLIAFIFHRWGILMGIFGGALMGAAFYFISFYVLGTLFASLYAAQGWPMLLGHILFGALAGGIYEALEEDWDDVPVSLRMNS